MINVTVSLPPGELVKKNSKESSNCEFFGLWIAIYTDQYDQKKHFLFDCNGLSDSIRQFCRNLYQNAPDAMIVRNNSGYINTDSIVVEAEKVLDAEFKARRARYPVFRIERAK